MSRSRSSRPAFTMIEVLVVLGIIAFLLAMFLPFVQRIREAAARTQSTNNQRQLAIGCHSFHDVFKTFPFNGTKGTFGDPNNRGTGSWVYQILPFIEQEPLFKNPKNFENVKIPTVMCPGRGRPGLTTEGKLAGPTSDYALNCWLNDDANGSLSAADKKISLVRIPDGTANTIMAGELAIKPADYEAKDAAEGRESFMFGGTAGTGRNGTKAVLDGPNSEPLLFGSPFRGGVPMCFADGSVRTIVYGLDLRSALLPADGKALEE